MNYTKLDYTISEMSLKMLLDCATVDVGYDTATTKFSRLKMMDINSPILRNDSLFEYLYHKYGNRMLYMIFRSPPKYHINYHIDRRPFGLNIPLTPLATAKWGKCDEEYYKLALSNGKLPSFWDIDELHYEVGVPYVVNTSVYHCIINNTDQNRYMLTFTFPNLSMNEFIEDMISSNFLTNIIR